MTRRRLALPVLVGALAIFFCFGLRQAAIAQQPAPPTIGILSVGGPANATTCGSGAVTANVSCFVDALRGLGYAPERNITLVYRFADGAYERLPGLAAELVSLRPDIIYTHSTPGAEAAAKATTTIPIIVAPAGESTMERLAGNLARSRGNVTGFALENVDEYAKCLQLMKDIDTRISRVAVLVNPDNPAWSSYPAVLEPAAHQVGVTLAEVKARSESDLSQAFAAIGAGGANALLMVNDAEPAGSSKVRRRIIDWAISRGVALATSSPIVTKDGGLLSLGIDPPALARRAAVYADKILKGAKPAELPVERPTAVTLSINLKTAKALGLTIPQSLLLRADEVIQ
jgi:putative ABC transport system substrate-binding protein